MVSMQAWLPEYDYSTRNASLAPLYSDLEHQKEFYMSRRKETQEVIDMLNDRIEAELTYAMRLDKISNYSKSFKIGNLAEEVENYKMSCAARARQAAEVSENVHQDCISPLKELIESQDAEFHRVIELSKKRQEKLHLIDADIKRTAMAYFKAAREAEDSVVKYQKIKYDAELTYISRQQIYDSMMNDLKELKDCEVEYKQTVDQANNYVQKFRRMILKYCRACRDLEIERCKMIHSSINQFVVFEMSAEMNNKYDAANFAKILEEFSPQQEMRTIDQYLYGVVQAQREEDFEEAHDGDRSSHDKNGASSRRQNSQRMTDSSNLSFETAQNLTKNGDDEQPEQQPDDQRSNDQLWDEITVLPNGFIPIVLNPKFEFVPFESKLYEDQNPMVARIDINQLTQVQLREPPARVSDFCRANANSLQKQRNGELNEEDKKELIFFLLQKIFCIGQQVYQMHAMHSEYTVLVKLLTASSAVDRNLFVYEFKCLFSGRQNVSQFVFKNLIQTVNAIYDSYLPPDNEIEGPESAATMTFDLTDLDVVRKITQQYYLQVPNKPGQAQYNAEQQKLMMTPCLESQLTHHRIWSFVEVWMGISKDLEISTFGMIQFFQDQMANYEVQPVLLEHVTLKLIQDMRAKQKIDQQQDQMTMGSENQSSTSANESFQMNKMTSEAEQACHTRIEQYREKYNERMEERRKKELLDQQIRSQTSVGGAKRASVAQSKKTPAQGLGQQISSLVGGLFSGGIKINDGSRTKNEGSPPRLQQQKSFNGQQTLAESSSRPSLAALLNKSKNNQNNMSNQMMQSQVQGIATANQSSMASALARRASPGDRMRSPLIKEALSVTAHRSTLTSGKGQRSQIGDPGIRPNQQPVNQIIVKKANYLTSVEGKRLAASSSTSRSPNREPPPIKNMAQCSPPKQLRSARVVNVEYTAASAAQQPSGGDQATTETDMPQQQPEQQ